MDPLSAAASPDAQAYRYSLTLTAIKSFYRLCDGVQTLFLVNRDGFVLDIVDLEQWRRTPRAAVPSSRCRVPRRTRAHALATAGNRNICVVLSPYHEIKVFAEGVQMFTFSNARWHLLDLKAKYDLWASRGRQPAAGRAPVPDGARSGGRAAGRAVRRAARRRRLAAAARGAAGSARSSLVAFADAEGVRADRPSSCTCCADARRPRSTPTVLSGLARIDGATVMDTSGRLLAVGAILLHGEPLQPHSTFAVEGARTTAAMAAARHGPVLKVSEDGVVTFFDRQEKIWDISDRDPNIEGM